MKKLLVGFLLILSVQSIAQQGEVKPGQNENSLTGDSLKNELKKLSDSLQPYQPAMDTAFTRREAERNGEAFLQLMKENNAKQKRAAMIRIAIGVGFLIILIIGLMRRRKK